MSEPYAMNSAVYDSLVKLCTDICKRNGKKKLLWPSDKTKTLNYAPKSDEMVLTGVDFVRKISKIEPTMPAVAARKKVAGYVSAIIGRK